jgi:hypothetical protein
MRNRPCGAFALLLSASQAAVGLGATPPSIADMKKMPGEIVAEARLDAPESPLRMTGYRVEKLRLSEPVSVPIEGRRVETQDAWRVTVAFARPLTVRDQAFSLVIDGQWCGFLNEAPDLRSADAICFNAALIRDGAALGVTYRTISIHQPADAREAAGPDADLAGDEPIHYASARLELRGGR